MGPASIIVIIQSNTQNHNNNDNNSELAVLVVIIGTLWSGSLAILRAPQATNSVKGVAWFFFTYPDGTKVRFQATARARPRSMPKRAARAARQPGRPGSRGGQAANQPGRSLSPGSQGGQSASQPGGQSARQPRQLSGQLAPRATSPLAGAWRTPCASLGCATTSSRKAPALLGL